MPWNDLDIEVIDSHVHLPVPWTARRGGRRASRPPAAQQLLADHGMERRAQWRKEWSFPEPEALNASPAEQAARWVAEAEKYSLRAVVMVTGGGNDTLAAVINDHPGKLYGMAHHDLARPDAGPELRRAVEELGLIGLKIIAPVLAVRLDDPALEPTWAYCEEKRLPVLIHFGWLGTGGGIVAGDNIDPLIIYEVASRHPAIPFLIPHFGCGYQQQALQLAWSCPNIYFDTSGSNQWIRWMPYDLSLEDLFRRTYETVGPRRFVFGTYSSWFPRGFCHQYLTEQIRACRRLGMKDEDVALVFGGNAARLYGLAG